MGLFSGIKKIFKKVISGVKKVFKPVTKALGKLMQKKWFKWVLIAAAVFTAGISLYAGITAGMAASAGGASLMSSYVVGAKAFMVALVNPITTAKAAFAGNLSVASRVAAAAQTGATAGLGGAGAAQAAITGPGVTTAGAAGPGLTTSAGTTAEFTGNLAAPAAAAAPVGSVPSGIATTTPNSVLPATSTPVPLEPLPPAPANPGMLTKAAKAVGGFAQTTGGGMLLAGALQGFGSGKLAEAELKERQRIEGLWNDPEATQDALDASGQPITLPEGARWGAAAQGQASVPWQIRKMYGYPPTVPFNG